jgi:hypothetical protein
MQSLNENDAIPIAATIVVIVGVLKVLNRIGIRLDTK